MTKKEKLYLRLGCLFLAVGLVITFSCGTLRVGWWSSHTESKNEQVAIAEEREAAEITEVLEGNAVEVVEEIPQEQAGDPINQAFQDGMIERLHLDSGFGEIHLSVGTSFYVEDYDGNRKSNVYVSGNTLYIENGRNQDSLYITLPSDYLFNFVDIDLEAGYLWMERLEGKSVMIDVGAGEMVAENIISEDNCQISCGAGSISAEQMSVNSLNVSVGLGSIYLNMSQLESADVKTGIGQTILELPGSSKDYDYQIACGAGEVIIDEDNYSGLGRSHGVVNGQGRMIRVDNGVGTTELYFEE